MVQFVLGFFIGAMFGVILMALVQINRGEE